MISWGLVIVVRQLPPLSFQAISFSGAFYLLVFFLACLMGTLVGPSLFSSVKYKPRPEYSLRSVNTKANLLILFTLISSILLIYKYLSLSGGSSISLSGVLDLRLERGRDSGDVKGETLSGVFGMAMSGFFIISHVFKELFFHELTAKKRKHLDMAFVIGIFTSFLSGGRFAAAIALTIVFVLRYVKKKTFLPPVSCEYKTAQTAVKRQRSFFSVLKKTAFAFVVIYLFSAIFIYKAAGSMDGVGILLVVLTENFAGISVPVSHLDFLSRNQVFIPVYFVAALTQYYIGHAFYQFDVLFNAPYPKSAPYLMQYQFYIQCLALNKLGFNFMSIQEILTEMYNPGVYLGLAGAFVLDFGFYGGVVLAFLFSVFGVQFWIKFLHQRRFFDAYVSILFLVLILFSPVVSLVGTGNFPSLLSLAFVVPLFIPKTVNKLKLQSLRK